jgi:multidrug efflux system outer membrane protein
VASVANAYLTWQADKELLKLTRTPSVPSRRATSSPPQQRSRGGLGPGPGAVAHLGGKRPGATGQYTRQVAQDENSLTLLLGTGIPANLPAAKTAVGRSAGDVPAGLPSDLLQRRPDILRPSTTSRPPTPTSAPPAQRSSRASA